MAFERVTHLGPTGHTRDRIPMRPRPPTLSGGAMVTSSHSAVSFVGAQMLAGGGNAVDATLAMAAMTWLTLPGQCGIGGDAFAVVREPDGTVWTVGGSGYGPDGAGPDFFAERGYGAIPLHGALAVAVPGAPAALSALHARGATRSLDVLWEPVARLADKGLPCSAQTRDDVRSVLAAVRSDPGLSAVYTPHGNLPDVGTLLPQPDLAQTIRTLARDPSNFYHGRIAEHCVEALRAHGAPFSGDEWQACARVSAEPALVGEYAGVVVHQTPLPTPGWMLLQQAALCDRIVGSSSWMSSEAIDRMARAARMSFEDRMALCGADSAGSQDVLSPEAIERQRGQLSGHTSIRRGFSVLGGDTTSTVAVDHEGRAVSFIHSLAFLFGAKFTVPGTGIVLNNRLGRGAYLIPDHPNEVRPRRKPLHTLNAWIVTGGRGNLLHVGNTPGGDGQVQWNMQLLSHLLDHGLDPQEAVSAPRFTVFPGSDADVVGRKAELRVESRITEETREALRAAGHSVVVQDPWGAAGSAQIISVDECGILSGGSDPRQQGVALGVE